MRPDSNVLPEQSSGYTPEWPCASRTLKARTGDTFTTVPIWALGRSTWVPIPGWTHTEWWWTGFTLPVSPTGFLTEDGTGTHGALMDSAGSK